MPSTTRWKKGSTDWNATASYYGGALPISGDTHEMEEGFGTADTNATTALAAVDLLALNVRADCKINLGSSTNPLRVDIDRTSTGIFDYQGGAQEVWLRGGSGTGIHYQINFKPNSNCRMTLSSGGNLKLYVYGGLVVVSSSYTIVDVDVQGGTCLIQEHASDLTGAINVGAKGVCICRRRIAAASVVEAGGTLEYDVDDTTTTSAITVYGRMVARKGSLTYTLRPGGEVDAGGNQKTGYTHTATTHEKSRVIFGALKPTFTETAVGRGADRINV